MNYRYHLTCTNCLRSESESLKLFRCSKCKGVMYCSRDCQTKDWSTHKKGCSPVDGSGIFTFVENVCSNPFLNTLLQACFILHFDLLRRPLLDKPFVAQVEFGIEPVDMTEFLALFLGNHSLEKKIEGVVQMNSFRAFTPDEAANIKPSKKIAWQKARDSATSRGLVGQSVGLVEFASGENRQGLIVPIFIERKAMDLVRASAPWEIPSGIAGEASEVPFNIETCMEFMNLWIRDDRDNKLLLRTEMRPSDIKLIRDIKQWNSTHSLPVLSFMEKMAREQIFKPILDTLTKLADAIKADPTIKSIGIIR